MKIADIEIGKEYGLAHTGGEPEDAYAKATVTAKHPGGNVTVVHDRGSDTIRARYVVAPWEVCAQAKRERRLRLDAESIRFDRRLAELEDARQRILAHLDGVDTDGLGYSLNRKHALGKEVRAHADRSGYWTGTDIRLDYVQIANLLDLVTAASDGDPDRTTDLSGEPL